MPTQRSHRVKVSHYAILLLRVQETVLGQDRYGNGILEHIIPEISDSNLPIYHESEGNIKHESADMKIIQESAWFMMYCLREF